MLEAVAEAAAAALISMIEVPEPMLGKNLLPRDIGLV